jgi:methyl-accepting chemotaxis protein
MGKLIDWISGSIRLKLMLITGTGTTLLLTSALFGLWQAWEVSHTIEGAAAQHLRDGILISLGLMGGAILLAFVTFLGLVQKNIVGPAHQLARDLNRLAQGDFSQPIAQSTNDEIGQVARSAEHIRNDLGEIVRNVMHATQHLGEAAGALADTATSIVQSSQNQSIAANTAASTIERVTSSIGVVSTSATEVRRLSQASLEESRTGNDQLGALMREMQNAVSAMQQISQAVGAFVEHTASISSMTQQVKGIADQTNLLALNAAIEAARAGESGRGFAVVADEVRKLAEKSGQAANEIDAMARSISEQSQQVTVTLERGQQFLESSQTLTTQAASALERTRDTATHTNAGVDNISERVKEQNAASKEISHLVEQIAAMAGDNGIAIQNSADSATHLVELAKNLEATVSRFKI